LHQRMWRHALICTMRASSLSTTAVVGASVHRSLGGGGTTVWAKAPEDDLHVEYLESVLLAAWQRQLVGTFGVHVAQGSASDAVQMVMGGRGVWVVTLRTITGGNLHHFAHVHQLVQRVVHGGEADLGEKSLGSGVHAVGSEVDVFASHNSSLDREPPGPVPQPLDQLANDLPPGAL
jgi:hypothetical protein